MEVSNTVLLEKVNESIGVLQDAEKNFALSAGKVAAHMVDENPHEKAVINAVDRRLSRYAIASSGTAGLTIIDDTERLVGLYFGEPLFEKIVRITTTSKLNTSVDFSVADLDIKKVYFIDAYGDRDGVACHPNQDRNFYSVWFYYGSSSIRHTITSASYANLPVYVTLRYTKNNPPTTELDYTGKVISSRLSVRYIVPENTTWNRGNPENYVVSKTLPLNVEAGKQYKLVSPFGTQVCLAEAYVKNGETWQKTVSLDYNSTGAHHFVGTMAACPGDGYLYLSTGINGLVCPVMGLSAPYVENQLTEAEVIVVLYCPDEVVADGI